MTIPTLDTSTFVTKTFSNSAVPFYVLAWKLSKHRPNVFASCCRQIGPTGDVKLGRTGPETFTVNAAAIKLLGKVSAQALEVNGKSIEQLIREILKEMLEKKWDQSFLQCDASGLNLSNWQLGIKQIIFIGYILLLVLYPARLFILRKKNIYYSSIR